LTFELTSKNSRVAAVPSAVGRRLIITVLSALYAVVFGQGCIQWYYLVLSFVTKGDTRLSLYGISDANPSSVCIILSNVLGSMGLLLADGLLVCIFHMNHSESTSHSHKDMEMLPRLCGFMA